MFLATIVAPNSNIARNALVFRFYYIILRDAFHHIAAIARERLFYHCKIPCYFIVRAAIYPCLNIFRNTNNLMGRHYYIKMKMYLPCQLCGKEFNNLSKGVQYSSVVKGFFAFCSDECCKNYLNSTKQ